MSKLLKRTIFARVLLLGIMLVISAALYAIASLERSTNIANTAGVFFALMVLAIVITVRGWIKGR